MSRFRLTFAAVFVLAASAWPAVLLAQPQSAQRWTTFMCNPQRTGRADGTTGPKSPRKVWVFTDKAAPAPFASSPAVVDGRVYVGSDNHRLYCLRADTGQVIWEFQAACEIFASPVVADGRVFLGEGLHSSNNARLYCLDAATGRKVWEFQTASHIEFSPSLFDGKLYVAAGADGVYCLDARNGRKLWQYTGVHVDMCPAVAERGVFFGNVYGEPAFHCLSAADGKLMWRRPAPYGVCGSPSTDGKRVCFGLGNGTFTMSHAKPLGSVHCLSADDGRLLWAATHVKDAVLTTVALGRGSAYFGSRDGHLYCVNDQTGEPRWAFNTGQPVVSSPAIADGHVYFGCDDGVVYCADAASGRKVWAYDTSGEAFNIDVRVLASPAIANGRLYIGSMSLFFCLGEAEHGPQAPPSR